MPKKKQPLKVSIPKDIVLAARELRDAGVSPLTAGLAMGVNKITYMKILRMGESPMFQQSTVDTVVRRYYPELIRKLANSSRTMNSASKDFSDTLEEIFRRIGQL